MDGAIKVAMIIERDNKFLLVQEGHAAAYGLWNWQQGKVEGEEDIENAAIREAKEETGYKTRIKRKLGIIENPFPDTKEIHVFLGEIVAGDLKIHAGEIIQAKWFSIEELDEIKDKMPGCWVYETIAASKE
jgi:ADP-ribose pyrophosphatase YjhB (NUDIX family)